MALERCPYGRVLAVWQASGLCTNMGKASGRIEAHIGGKDVSASGPGTCALLPVALAAACSTESFVEAPAGHEDWPTGPSNLAVGTN